MKKIPNKLLYNRIINYIGHSSTLYMQIKNNCNKKERVALKNIYSGLAIVQTQLI